VTSESPAPASALRLGERHNWIAAVADQPIDPTIFDTRSRNGLRRRRVRTWGELGRLDDAALLEVAHIGELTVSRIHMALASHGARATSRSAADACQSASAAAPEPRPESADLRIAAEWASVVTDDTTLGALVEACVNEDEIPKQAGDAVANLLAVPFAQLSGREVAPLSERIGDLLAEVSDPGLLAAREFQQVRPTWASLGRDRNVTGEAVRRRVARDAPKIRGLLASDQFRAIRWAAERLRTEFGIAVRSDSDVVEGWRVRLGDARFEALRWLARYVYEDDWLFGAGTTRSSLARALDDAVGDEWLFKAEDLVCWLPESMRPEAALSFLMESGAWRDIGDGWLVRWDGPLQVKAGRVLALVGRPMTPAELVEAIGYGSEGSLKNQRGSALVRVDKRFRLALPEWGHEEYEGITTEIAQRIERGGGVASMSAMLEEFVRDFDVKAGSVRGYLEAGPYVISGDEVRHLADRGYTPNSVADRQHAVKVGDMWGQRLTVADHNFKGYSFGLDRDVAAHNGLQPDDSLLVPAIHGGAVVGEASLIWRLTNLQGTVDAGRLSSVLDKLDISVGDEIIIVPARESCTVLRPDELAREARAILSDDVKRVLLGRK
jgi:hypothetical protein